MLLIMHRTVTGIQIIGTQGMCPYLHIWKKIVYYRHFEDADCASMADRCQEKPLEGAMWLGKLCASGEWEAGRSGWMGVAMRKFELIAPCHFGTESVLKKEIIDLGYDVTEVADGRVTFFGDEEAVCRANIFLRTAERILIKVGSFRAETFEELFQGTRALPWEEYIPKDGKFWVTKAASVKSKLFSPSDIQSIMKKAMVERLKESYHVSWFAEDGECFPVRAFLMKDLVTVGLDSTGESLHKRGYRKLTAKAPLAENLAAALILLTPWNRDRILVDPFCGSGTFLIEAAMMAAGMAPGMNREFTAESWKHIVDGRLWYDTIDEARELVDLHIDPDIQGYDIDDAMVSISRENARVAGVDKLIHFQRRGVEQLSHPRKYGFLITNPPYGERLQEKEEMPALYRTLGERYRALDAWSLYVISAYEGTEHDIGRKADKNRKIYNGMMKTYYYQFLGPKPPKQGRRPE